MRGPMTDAEGQTFDGAIEHVTAALVNVLSASKQPLPILIHSFSTAEGHLLLAAGALRDVVKGATARLFEDEHPLAGGL